MSEIQDQRRNPAKTQWTKGVLFLAIGTIVVIAFTALMFPYIFVPSPYLNFIARDTKYYSQIAYACNALLAQHPVSSNDTVMLYSNMTLPASLQLPVDDRSIPKIIKTLHPNDILISSNRVYIEVPPERRGGFAIIWQRTGNGTNQGVLTANAEDIEKTVYSESSLLFK